MKKKIIITGISVVVFLVFAGVIMNIVTNKSRTLSESESSEISKILITNGNTGDVKKIEDEAGISKINESFRKVEGKKRTVIGLDVLC